MKARSLEEVASAVDGSISPPGATATVTGASVDSREISPGDLFVALSGAHSDGHSFAARALDAGAAACMIRRGHAMPSQGPWIEVDDTARALLDLARVVRSELRATVVAITGSTGKTCTKDFTASILSRARRVVASPASFNNEVGLPLTLLQADDDTEVVVCEMGSRGRGHIRLLCDVAKPDVGVVTNVGTAHMELFGTPETLRDAKAELPEALPPDGKAVLNADDPVTRAFSGRTAASSLFYSSKERTEVRAEAISLDPRTGLASFDLHTPQGSSPVKLSVPGEHMVSNALAAAAVASVIGLTVPDSAAGLAEASVSGGRMRMMEAPGGIRILDDSYNANPTSMAAALRAARWMAGDGQCIAVLGPMAELGPIAEVEHERVGEILARLGIGPLVVVGDEARRIAVGAEREGVEPDQIHVCDGVDEAIEIVRTVARPGDLILVKASRVAALERVANALLALNGAKA